MPRLHRTVTITTAEIYSHIPAYDKTNEPYTLCHQVIHKDLDPNEYPPTCPGCLEILYYCKSLDIRTPKQIQESIDDNFFDEEYS